MAKYQESIKDHVPGVFAQDKKRAGKLTADQVFEAHDVLQGKP